MPGTLSVILKEKILQSVARTHGDLESLRAELHAGDGEKMNSVAQTIDKAFHPQVDSLQSEVSPAEAEVLTSAVQEPHYARRVKQTAMEAVYGEQLCPSLNILSELETADLDFINSGPVHAIVVEQMPHVVNEVYPLMLDAYVHDLETEGEPHHTVVCVHTSWLNDELTAERAIVYLHETDTLAETPLIRPLDLDRVHFLCMPTGAHAEWSQKFLQENIPVVNPYNDVAITDDKFACYETWKVYGVKTPDAHVFQTVDVQEQEKFLARLKEIFDAWFANAQAKEAVLVLQPNTGTEGRGAKAFRGPLAWEEFLTANPGLIPHALDIADRDCLLVRQGIGNALIYDERQQTHVAFDIRLNVVDGEAESGFFTIGRGREIVTSPGSGGQVWEWKSPGPYQLAVEGQSHSITLGDASWRWIELAAEKAVTCFKNMNMAGVDIRLHFDGEEFTPYVLDINPRPAGLSHSRFFDTLEPGVTQQLWMMDFHID